MLSMLRYKLRDGKELLNIEFDKYDVPAATPCSTWYQIVKEYEGWSLTKYVYRIWAYKNDKGDIFLDETTATIAVEKRLKKPLNM